MTFAFKTAHALLVTQTQGEKFDLKKVVYLDMRGTPVLKCFFITTAVRWTKKNQALSGRLAALSWKVVLVKPVTQELLSC